MNMRHPNVELEHSLAGDSVPAMIWVARPDMSCEYVSRPWLDFTGYSLDQALGDGWSRGVHPEDLARWLDTCLRAFDAREPFELEYRLRRRDGEYRWILERGAARFGESGSFLGYVGTCIDIEERKRAEIGIARSLERERKLRLATEEASRLKDGFVSSVLENLLSPVQAIQTWAAHLRRQVPAGSEAGQALDAIEANACAQGRIMASLLDLSGLASGKPPLRRCAADRPLLGGVRVLVVDDDPGARETVLRILGIAGAETRWVASASEALELLAMWRPDALIADMGMRGDAALVLIRALRALPAELGSCVRAAALCNETVLQDGRRAVHAGYDAQLTKPVEPVALLATLARLAAVPGNV